MKLIMIRHGITLENLENVVQGHELGTLSEEGVRQAKEVAKSLSKYRIDLIYSSDLKRTKDTTKEIALYHRNIPINYVEELREIDAGEYVGMKMPEGKHLLDYEVKGGETLSQLQNRVGRFLSKMTKEHQGKTVLLVTHGITVRAIFNYLERKDPETIRNTKSLKNTEIVVIELDDAMNFKRV